MSCWLLALPAALVVSRRIFFLASRRCQKWTASRNQESVVPYAAIVVNIRLPTHIQSQKSRWGAEMRRAYERLQARPERIREIRNQQSRCTGRSQSQQTELSQRSERMKNQPPNFGIHLAYWALAKLWMAPAASTFCFDKWRSCSVRLSLSMSTESTLPLEFV